MFYSKQVCQNMLKVGQGICERVCSGISCIMLYG